MAKDTGKKIIGKKIVKETKKSSKLAVETKAPPKAKMISSAKESKQVKDVKTTKGAKSEKLEKAANVAARSVEKEKTSLLSKIAGKIFKSEANQNGQKYEDAEERSGAKVSKGSELVANGKDKAISKANGKAKGSDEILKTKDVKESKKAKEPKVIREEAIQVNVIETEAPVKKLSKKAQASFQAATEEEAKWMELKEKYKGIRPSPYKMSEIYQEKTLLDHKVLGLGVILSVVNDRLEVLFQTGTKHLISNYKK
jgi:hypothetical protein